MSVNTQKMGFYLIAALLVATVIAAALLMAKRRPEQYEARGMFYFGSYGREKESLLIEDWSGPDRLCMFMEHLWDGRPDDFMQRVIRRLHDEYDWVGNDDVAMKAVDSIEFHRSVQEWRCVYRDQRRRGAYAARNGARVFNRRSTVALAGQIVRSVPVFFPPCDIHAEPRPRPRLAPFPRPLRPRPQRGRSARI